MTSIAISPEELRQGRMTPEHLAASTWALREDGYVVLEDVVDLDHLAVLRERMLKDLKDLLARPDAPFNFNTGNVQQDPPPFPPFLFEDVLLNPIVIQATKAILGRGVKNHYYSGNTNLPGTLSQPVHVDTGQLWPNQEVAHPAAGLVVNVPVVDMDVRNGSTEIWPGTHRDTTVCVQDLQTDADIRVPEERVEARRAEVPPIQPFVRLGSVLIRDIRLWHRGMPNHTAQPRPMIAMIHTVGWWPCSELEFPRGTEEFFKGSELHTVARFVDGPLDYIHRNKAYDYTPPDDEAGVRPR